MLTEDIAVRVGCREIAEHLRLHPGVEAVQLIDDRGEPYAKGSFVPTREKRRLADDELNSMATKWHWPASSCISSFKVSESDLTQMRSSEVARGFEVGSTAFCEVGTRLWQGLCKCSPLFSFGEVQWLGVSERPSGLRTSTFDGHLGKRIGMHLDNWDRLPLHMRGSARVRVCINIGEGTRSLLFVPFDVRMISDLLEDDLGDHCQNIGSEFLRRFPDTPVMELVIPPGYAYLAPTDNIIHDGTSLPGTRVDLTIAWLGFIGYSDAFSD